MMPPLPALVLLLLRLLLAAGASSSAGSFTCAKPSTCQPAIGYVVPDATTYEKLISRFRPTTLRDLIAANQLPLDTDTRQAIPARTALHIPFRCRCTGDGVGRSDLYTVQTGDGDLEIVTANNALIAAEYHGQKHNLPCSCDKVDGSDVMHFAYVVRSAGDNSMEIAAKYGVPESTLLRINNITNHTSLHRGQILDIPLQGMGMRSRVHYISGSRRSLGGSMNEGKALAIVKVLKNPFFGVFAAIALSFYFATWYYWSSALKALSSGKKNGVMQFDYDDLARRTRGFSKKCLIGEGAFGAVYKATYKGQELAVKKMKSKGKTEDFHAELQTISNTRHTNLVRLKGWCGRIRLIDGKTCWKRQIKVELLLVFEWIPLGTIEDHLYNREQVLPWEKRYKIVKGIGSALRYLHHECNPCILHRDIKPGNILVDDDFNAKVADFGLSLIAGQNRGTVVTNSMGTWGYMDPVLRKDGNVEFNRKSDVYSFGLVLLEIACLVAIEKRGENKGENQGRKSREEILELYSRSAEPEVEAVADPNLAGVFNKKEMERVVFLGLKCSHPEETKRPSMEDAMKFLEDGQELPSAAQGEGGYTASFSVYKEEEAPMMPHGASSSS